MTTAFATAAGVWVLGILERYVFRGRSLRRPAQAGDGTANTLARADHGAADGVSGGDERSTVGSSLV